MGLLICSEMEWHGMDGMIVLLALFSTPNVPKTKPVLFLEKKKVKFGRKKQGSVISRV